MVKQSQTEMNIRAGIEGKIDGERDHGAGLVDLMTLGMFTDSKYDPPKDNEEARVHYEIEFEKAKNSR
jgi:hypothetical protein